MTPVLVPLYGTHKLAPNAGASWHRARLAGCPLGIESSTRTYEEQAALRRRWESNPRKYPFARRPGDSKHEKGIALDLHREPELWMRAHPEYGWRFTDPKERWHCEYFEGMDDTLIGLPIHTNLDEITGDEMKPWFFRRKNDGLICIVTSTGVRALTREEWAVWVNLGQGVFPSGMGDMDEGPFNIVVKTLGGYR